MVGIGPIPELDILLACEQTQWSRNGGEDERIKTHENEKYRLQRVRTLHFGVVGKVEEARLAESLDFGTAVVDGE